jgi:hypothetical protein
MSSSTGDKTVPDITTGQADMPHPVTAPRMCSVDLPDGSPCSAPLTVGSYCERHSAVGDRDFQIFQMAHEHYEQDLRMFWQRSNFYLVVDGFLVSAFVTAHLRSLQIVLACAGLMISLFWLLVARSSIRWVALWRAEVQRLDRIVNRFQSFDAIENQQKGKPWTSPSWLTQWLPALFLTGWICIFLLLILRVTSI